MVMMTINRAETGFEPAIFVQTPEGGEEALISLCCSVEVLCNQFVLLKGEMLVQESSVSRCRSLRMIWYDRQDDVSGGILIVAFWSLSSQYSSNA